jgi:hypothetical protein
MRPRLARHIAPPPYAMNARVITDIRKEAICARSENLDDETKPIPGLQFAPRRRRSPNGTAPRRSRAIPRTGGPLPRDDCNLRSSRAQFDKGANRVFYKQIDAP